MKTKLMKRGLCIALVAVMLLGFSVINASACSHSSDYWEWNHATWFDYYQLDEFEHDVCKSDVALCKLCDAENVYCTHWYSESHSLANRSLYSYEAIVGGWHYIVNVREWYCINNCGYSYTYEVWPDLWPL